MAVLSALWLPILVSAVVVFVASSIIHMVLPWHKSDYLTMPNQDKAMDALRPLAIPPGDYMVPRPSSMHDMRSAEFIEKMKQGPVMVVTVMPNGPASMGRNLAGWFLYLIVVSVFAALVASVSLPAGADHHDVIHTVVLVAFIGYALALWQMSIWYRRAWSTTFKSTVDGAIYAAITAVTFAWMWPR